MSALTQMRLLAARNGVPILRPEAERLLRTVLAEHRPQRILELGTAIGYSALLMAEALPCCRVVTLEKDAERVRLARQFFAASPSGSRIELLAGDAAQLLPSLAPPFDLVFLDAAKGHYLSCLQQALPLLRPGSVVVADDVLFYGQVYGPCPRRMRTIAKRMRQYLEFVQNEDLFQTTIHPDGDGFAVSVYQGADSHEHP